MDKATQANSLLAETSPYLRMHAYNPVHWYPWNEEALAKARAENKPILLSIGYTACHWCHVMAKESFEDQDTANLMNDNFINIKVDREERPDLDKIYQLAYQIFAHQAGGWPLTVFLMPDTLIPFFVGTYFPKEPSGNLPAFKVILEYVAYFYKHHQNEIQQQNNSLKKVFDIITKQDTAKNITFDPSLVNSLAERLIAGYDKIHGGFGTQPKFPMTSYLHSLLIIYDYTKEKSSGLKNIIEHSLLTMCRRGLYDHLAGGFFRYCVDDNWTIPHFEKMLYDNAQLLSLYVETYLITRNLQFKAVALQTANWLLTDMQSDKHGFFATIAADSEGEEGKYYVWTKSAVQSVLSEDEYKLIEQLYGLDQPPNFEDHWHLVVNKSHDNLASELRLSSDQMETLIDESNQKLLESRNKRPAPEIDDKILVAWNALTIKSLLLTGHYLNQPACINAAEDALSFIKKTLWKDGRLSASYAKAQMNEQVYLDDYAFLIQALLYSLSVKWNTSYLQFAISLIDRMLKDFADTEVGGFYFTEKNREDILLRIKQHQDDAIPSGNALATQSLLFFGFLLGNTEYLSFAELSIKNAFKQMREVPEAHCHFFINLMAFLTKPEIIILRGPQEEIGEWQAISKNYYHAFRLVFAISNAEKNLPSYLASKYSPSDAVIAYYCHGFECKSPITSLQEFENVLRQQPYLTT